MAVNGHDQPLEDLASTLSQFGISEVPTFENAYPALNPVDIYRAHLTELLVPITGADPKVIYQAIQWTQTLEKGDCCLPVPALRIKGKKPDDVAKAIEEQFPESPLVEKPVVEGTFVQFWFKAEPLKLIVLSTILKKSASYGFNPSNGRKDPEDKSKGRKKMIVEFSSPNIAKPFHAGHLRSTIIGGFLSNLYEKAGWDVVRMNYLGDWGKQYGVLALGFQRFGSEEALEKNPIGHLYEVYVKINVILKAEENAIKEKRLKVNELQGRNESVIELETEIQKDLDQGTNEKARRYFKRMCDGDSEAVGLWTKFRELSIVKYKATYSRLNIWFDDYSGESQVREESMDSVAKIMEEKGVSEVSDGAVIVDLTKYSKKLGKALVRKKDGTSLYLTRDIGGAIERDERYKFDKMIYVVASQQDLHLAQLFKIEEAMGRKDIRDKCLHINFGMVQGMSTRKGTAKFLDDILRDVGDTMHDVMRSNETKYQQVENPVQTADTLGISAVMVQDMKGKRINDYEFNMERMCSFEGDTGPYLQYAHARLCSITRRAAVSHENILTADLSLLQEKHAIDVVRSLAQWPDVFQNTLKTLEPATVLTYLFKLTHLVSSSYDHLQVLGSEEPVRRARMALYTAARTTLSNGMLLLGLNPVERM